MPRKTIAVLLLAFALFSAHALLSGARYLETLLPGGLPLGNALTALGLCAAAGAALALSPRRSRLRRVALGCLTAAAAWLPVSIALAGNAALNFANARGQAWILLSLCVVAAVFLTLAWALVAGAWETRDA